MFLIDKKSYENTLAILKKEKALTPMFAELKQYIESEFGITVYNITYELYDFFKRPKKYSYAYGKNHKLICHVPYEYKDIFYSKIPVEIHGRAGYRLEPDKQKHTLILSKFFELAKKHNYPAGAKAKKIWIDCYGFFYFDYMSSLVSKIEKQINSEIISKHAKEAGIWEIFANGFSVIVFYKTEAQMLSNNENGISDDIRKEYFSAVSAVDDLGFYKEEYITFDSKENLDKKYNGDLQMYLR